MNDRFDVEHALRASASAPTPIPDRAFVDGLERRLASGPMAGNVLPFARRARRLSAGVVIAGSLAFAGVAAAAGIAVTHPFEHDAAPAPATTSTTIAIVHTEPSTTVAPTEQPTVPATVPATVPVPTVHLEPVTVPPVEPPTTVHHEPPPTTEVKVAATMTLSCVAIAGPAVQCTWGEGPAGTGHYDLLRSDGRAFVNIEHTLTWTDTAPPAGPVSYLVHAMSFNPNSVSLAHSGSVSVNCC
jgi:hypothetical protein